MSKKPCLIIISGLPGTGKTTLSKRISEEIGFPLIGVDIVKEVMWETMGYEFDFELTDKIGKTSFELLYYFIETNLAKGVSLIAEAHFSPEKNNERINGLKEKYNARLLQIHCDCETEALRKRFKERMEKDTYHKGHKHVISVHGEAKVLDNLGIKNKKLSINGETYELDTTQPVTINYKELYKFIYDNLQQECKK